MGNNLNLKEYPQLGISAKDSLTSYKSSPNIAKIDTINNKITKEFQRLSSPSKATNVSQQNRGITEEYMTKARQIGFIQDNEAKVKAWAKLNSKSNYIILDKTKCSATVYDKDGKQIKTYEVGIGEEKGDNLNDAEGVTGTIHRTTPPGEYQIEKMIPGSKDYGNFVLSLNGKGNRSEKSVGSLALHRIPKSVMSARLPKFNDGNLENNRMSHGCINLLPKDILELFTIIGENAELYVLPEESDNKLRIMKNAEGKFELAQTKYKPIDY